MWRTLSNSGEASQSKAWQLLQREETTSFGQDEWWKGIKERNDMDLLGLSSSGRTDYINQATGPEIGRDKTTERPFCWSGWTMMRPQNQGCHGGGTEAEGEATWIRELKKINETLWLIWGYWGARWRSPRVWSGSEVGLRWTALPSAKSGNTGERRNWGRGGGWVQFDKWWVLRYLWDT